MANQQPFTAKTDEKSNSDYINSRFFIPVDCTTIDELFNKYKELTVTDIQSLDILRALFSRINPKIRLGITNGSSNKNSQISLDNSYDELYNNYQFNSQNSSQVLFWFKLLNDIQLNGFLPSFNSHDNYNDNNSGEFLVTSPILLAGLIKDKLKTAPGRPLVLIDIIPILTSNGIIVQLDKFINYPYKNFQLNKHVFNLLNWEVLEYPQNYDENSNGLFDYFLRKEKLDSSILKPFTKYFSLTFDGLSSVINAAIGSSSDYYDENITSANKNDNNEQLSSDDGYVFIKSLDSLVKRVINFILSQAIYPTDLVIPTNKLRNLIIKSQNTYTSNDKHKKQLSLLDLELIEFRIFSLGYARLAIDPFDKFNHLIKFNNDKAHAKSLKFDTITKYDFCYVKLIKTVDNLNKYINLLTEQSNHERELATKLINYSSNILIEKDKAKFHLRKSKVLSKEVESKIKTLETLENLLIKIQSSQSQLEVHEAIKNGTNVLNNILSQFTDIDDKPIDNPENIVSAILDNMNKLQESLENASTIDNIINEINKESIDDLENDDELLQNLESLKISTPSTSPSINDTQKLIDNNEKEDTKEIIEDMLKKAPSIHQKETKPTTNIRTPVLQDL